MSHWQYLDRFYVEKQGPFNPTKPWRKPRPYSVVDEVRAVLNISDYELVTSLYTGSASIVPPEYPYNDLDVVILQEGHKFDQAVILFEADGWSACDNYNDGDYKQHTVKKYVKVFNRDVNVIMLNDTEWFDLWQLSTDIAKTLQVYDKSQRGWLFHRIIGH